MALPLEGKSSSLSCVVCRVWAVLTVSTNVTVFLFLVVMMQVYQCAVYLLLQVYQC